MSNAIAIIPARLGSTRLPRKMLLSETGLPLVCHTYRAVSAAAPLAATFIATGDSKIEDAATDCGCRVIRTKAEHDCGTSRVWEAANIIARFEGRRGRPKISGDTIVLNVQGDEPEIDRRDLEFLIDRMERNRKFSIGTLVAEFPDDENNQEAMAEWLDDRNVVKAACGAEVDGAMCREVDFFSREMPDDQTCGANGRSGLGWLVKRHVGVYAFRFGVLENLVMKCGMFPPPAVKAKSGGRGGPAPLEQENWIDKGFSILAVEASHPYRSIDTAEDYRQFVERTRTRFQRWPKGFAK